MSTRSIPVREPTAASNPGAPPSALPESATRAPSAVIHVAAAVWIATMLLLGSVAPETYERLLQEDRFIEWWTVTLFAAAAGLAFARAVRGRRPFDALVGLFCLFVAGEEFSWGQRLLGLTPPAAFLEHNRQQELTIHNFADVFGSPKWVLVIALLGFGLVLPAAARLARGRALQARVGATVPHAALAAWFLGAALLLVWYPLTLTGEWVEALAGGLFLTTYSPAARRTSLIAAGGAAAALALTWVSGVGAATEAELACARAETDALAQDLAYGTAATGRLAGATRVHKRVFTAAEDGYIAADRLTGFAGVQCAGTSSADGRRAHAIDPWGSAYWVRMERGTDGIRLEAYSFGPNRRRDRDDDGDDIVAALLIRP